MASLDDRLPGCLSRLLHTSLVVSLAPRHQGMEDANGRAEYDRQTNSTKMLEGWPTIAFVIPLSTGILSTILFQLNWQFRGSEIIATIVWLLTIVLFPIFNLLYILKIILFPKSVRRELTTATKSLCFLASPSIILGTIVNMTALVCAKAWGPSWGMVAYVLS